MSPHLTTRSIRSFVLRQGRLTEGQRHNLDEYWPHFGVDVVNDDMLFDLAALFQRDAPVWLEVGFGNGEALGKMAQAHPHINFLGIEVHLPGVGHALGEIVTRELSNVRLVRHDALEVLARQLPAGSLQRVMLFFPDPWHKRRHHKRRIVNAEFVTLVQRALTAEGVLHFATDWQPYARWIEQVMVSYDKMQRLRIDQQLDEIFSVRPRTKFEQRGLALGHLVSELAYCNGSARSDEV